MHLPLDLSNLQSSLWMRVVIAFRDEHGSLVAGGLQLCAGSVVVCLREIASQRVDKLLLHARLRVLLRMLVLIHVLMSTKNL